MGSTSIRVLGPLELDGGGALGGPKQRALLVLLALSVNQPVSRDRIVDRLWPEDPPESARRAVEVYVSQLRKTLPDGAAIVATVGGYRLEAAEDALDARRFERLAETGRELVARGGADEEAVQTLTQALGLWRGAIEAPSDDATVAKLEELRAGALEDLFEAKLALGLHEAIAPDLEAAIAEHPYRERLRLHSMLALYRSGRQAEALNAYRRARRALRDELGLEPSEELRALEAAILRQDPALTVEPAELRARRHLPAPTTVFVGRRDELAEVVRRYRDERARLVTVTGPGGAGKTRLALQAAHDLASRFDDGVYFVDLSPLTDPALLEETVAAVLGIKDAAPLDEYVARRRLLLVLDNFEQVDAAAPRVGDLLRLAPSLAVLVTSRSALRLYGEHVFAVPPLDEEDAVDLFVARARAAGGTVERSKAVREICAWLDRLPLAIELVAARSRELPPSRLLELLPPRLEVAAEGPRDAPARHRALRATIDWSYDLLSEREQRTYRRIAVFAGSFALEAAESVCGADRADITGLAAASLIDELEPGGMEPRYALLQTIREHTLDRLESSGEAVEVRRAHALEFLALAERAEPELGGSSEDVWLDRLEPDHDNLRAALDWTAAGGRVEEELRMAVALRRFWLVRGHVREAQRRLESVLARSDGQPPRLRATAMGAAGAFAVAAGDSDRARAWTEQSLELFRSLDDGVGVANSLNRLADIAKAENDPEAASRLYQAALEVARRLPDRRPLGAVLTNAGAFGLLRGETAEAEKSTAEALAVWRELGHTEGIAIALSNLGVAAVDRDAFEEALPYLEEGFELALRLSYTTQLAQGLLVCAALGARIGAHDRAACLLAVADEIFEATDTAPSPHGRLVREETIALVEDALSGRELAAARDAGRAMSAAEAVRYALETVRSAQANPRIQLI